MDQKGTSKHAAGESSGGALLSTAGTSPLPQPQVVPRIAPGKQGPIGMGAKNNFSRVNTGTMPVPDAGASSQKSLSPKYGSIMITNGAGMVGRPTLQEMVKAAQEGALSRTRISEEADRLSGEPESTKTANVDGQSIPTEHVTKLAEALEFLAGEFGKESAAPPAHLTEHIQAPGKGPGALEVSQATASTSLPDKKGQGHTQPPMKPGEEKVRASDAAGNALQTNMGHPTHGKAPMKIASANPELAQKNLERLAKIAGVDKTAAGGKCEKCGKSLSACTCKPAEKSASADLLASNLERLGIKKEGEDAINPAKISAGKAVPPDTSAAGQPGGEPAGGKPGPGTDMVGTNKGAISYTKGQAKAGPKSDLKKYFQEPALTSSTDSALRAAFDNTAHAGTKFGSAGEGGVKIAAARALLETLFEDGKTKAVA